MEVGTIFRQAAIGDLSAVLATKLHVPPEQEGFVARPRLAALLDAAPTGALILVCAPAGFGKTVLLADWVRSRRESVAWLSLDAADSDPARFWRHAIVALDGVRTGTADLVRPLLEPPVPPSLEGLVTAIVNGLAALSDDGEVVLVLDDYHLIESQAVHDSLVLLLEHAPPGLRLVVASRADPPLAQARLRARGRLVEVRAADLRFTMDETAAFFHEAVGSDLRSLGDVLPALADRTEGWAAGLKLAALSIRGRSDVAAFVEAFSGRHRFVLDFLTEEVLQRQADTVRRFLLETSVLERLSGPLCDAVTGRTDSQVMLEEIERANLFLVPLDEVRGWWRYHHLFADLLRARLQREQPDSVATLHRRAAAWHADHGQADDAVRHALAAGDMASAVAVIEGTVYELLLARGEGGTVERWLAALPHGTVESRSRLILARATVALQRGRLEVVEGLLDAAEDVYGAQHDQAGQTPLVGAGELRDDRARIATYRAFLAELRGDTDVTTSYALEGLAELGDGDPMLASVNRIHLAAAEWQRGRLPEAERMLSSVIDGWYAAGLISLAVTRSHHLGHVQRAQGNLRAELRTYERALDMTVVPGRPVLPAAGVAYMGLAEVAYQRNDLDAADRHITAAIPLCRQQTPYTHALAPALANLAWICHARGDTAGSAAAMAEAASVALSSEIVDLVNPVPAMRARLLLAQGDIETVAAWVAQRGLDAGDAPTYLRQPAQLILARLLLARDSPVRALALLDRLLAVAVEQGHLGSVIEIHALRSLALSVTGDADAALDGLVEALSIGHPQGWLRVFVDEGEPMGVLLGQVVAKRARSLTKAGVPLGYLQQLGTAFEPRAGRGASNYSAVGSPAPSMLGLIERLTERELEVLRLLAAGRTNREMAAELFVTLDTIKKHTTHILAKLGASNRTEAAARARELGLIGRSK